MINFEKLTQIDETNTRLKSENNSESYKVEMRTARNAVLAKLDQHQTERATFHGFNFKMQYLQHSERKNEYSQITHAINNYGDNND